MSAPSFRTARILAAVLLLASGMTMEFGGTAHAANAVQRAADRASHDRWARSEPSTGHASAGDDADEEESHHSKDKEPAPGHAGELNGRLSLKGW